jgi:hypothetical protein
MSAARAASIPATAGYRAAKLGIRGEKPSVTQAKRLRVAADTALISALQQALAS